MSTRHIPLAGSYNVRDLGGYTTTDGRQTRWRRLLRADGLHSLTTEAQESLIAEGVSTIIDLRYPEEITRQPNVFADSTAVQYVNVSLFGTEQEAHGQPPRAASLGELYCQALDSASEQIRTVFEIITETPVDQGVLFHCTVGKDRTGMIAALALGLIHVPAETIIEDYTLTDHYLEPLLQKWRDQAASAGRDMKEFETFLYAKGENMQLMLTTVQTRFGSAEGYLRSIGLSDGQLEAVQKRLLD